MMMFYSQSAVFQEDPIHLPLLSSLLCPVPSTYLFKFTVSPQSPEDIACQNAASSLHLLNLVDKWSGKVFIISFDCEIEFGEK